MLFSLLILSNCLKGNTYGYSTKKIPKFSEDLDRGVVVINTKSKESFISWRYLLTDDDNISFNIYREDTAANNIVKLNTDRITKVTNFRDTSRGITKEYNYFVGSIVHDEEVENSTKYRLAANTPVIPCYHVPLRQGCKIRTVWPGDLNGDGKFDFVIDRNCEDTQKVEGYLSDGTFLWEIELGHNSMNRDNIKPGATTINVGHWDGVNVYDLDGDGKAEVFLRIANNVTFGDGYTFLNNGHDENYPYVDSEQWMACVDGMTGKLKQKVKLPDIYLEHGPLALQLGVGYPNGLTPSLIGVMKNRDKKNNFHMLIATYTYDEKGNFIQDWMWERTDGKNCQDGHHFRIADVDFDGVDEILEIGFALNGNGTLRYQMGRQNVVHGDRFYTGRYNKDDDTMMGYGVQQLNPTNLTEYYYNASSGEVMWRHILDKCIDNGRGNVGDFDPRTPGLEVYSYFGMYNAKNNEMVANNTSSFWPSNNVFWDGTLSTASYHKNVVNKWNAEKGYAERLITAYSEYYKIYKKYFTGDNTYPLFHGDIIGDWREEFIVATDNFDALVIFTTNYDTEYKITTLSQDPGMRSSMTLNGYKQSHMSLMYMATDMDIDDERQYIKKYVKARALKGGSFCKPGYGLERKKDGEYTGECVKCIENCLSCYKDSSICDECDKGFSMNDDFQCIDDDIDDNEKTNSDEINDSINDDNNNKQTNNDEINDSINDDNNNKQTNSDEINDSINDDNNNKQTNSDEINDSINDDNNNKQTNNDEMNDSINDDNNDKQTNSDEMNDSINDDNNNNKQTSNNESIEISKEKNETNNFPVINKNTKSKGKIIGIVVGCIIAVVVTVTAIVFVYIYKKKKRRASSSLDIAIL